jgi:hypothetical protein
VVGAGELVVVLYAAKAADERMKAAITVLSTCPVLSYCDTIEKEAVCRVSYGA